MKEEETEKEKGLIFFFFEVFELCKPETSIFPLDSSDPYYQTVPRPLSNPKPTTSKEL